MSLDFSKTKSDIENLLKLCSCIGSLPEGVDLDSLVQEVGVYLDSLEKWQAAFVGAAPLGDGSAFSDDERSSIRALLAKLDESHRIVLAIVDRRKELVAGQMGELHHRGKALKSYLDKYPARITIAGKRTG
ncbi:MAG: hypothetical protein IT291_07720 [Deltaproteobacteria bacterium]|nr:hypothetical protein [Deltaproteobacteria bacterium]